jgi:hypothetical protein
LVVSSAYKNGTNDGTSGSRHRKYRRQPRKNDGQVDACQEKMDAWLEEMKGGRKETTACQEATEANPGEQQSVRVVPKEEAAVEMF